MDERLVKTQKPAASCHKGWILSSVDWNPASCRLIADCIKPLRRDADESTRPDVKVIGLTQQRHNSLTVPENSSPTTAIPSGSCSDMKEDFAFITIIITVYHFWMYGHLLSFKWKSGHWAAHVVPRGGPTTVMIHSPVCRRDIRAPLLSLKENNTFDLFLFP